KTLPPREMADAIQRAAEDLPRAIEEASPAQLLAEVDLGWNRMPLGRSTYVAQIEAVYHDWDLHVGRDPAATIPTDWAQAVASGMAAFAPLVANSAGITATPGRYLLEVGDGVGPITLIAEDTDLEVEQGRHGTPEVTLHLTADQYVRLV